MWCVKCVSCGKNVWKGGMGVCWCVVRLREWSVPVWQPLVGKTTVSAERALDLFEKEKRIKRHTLLCLEKSI